MTIRIIDPIGVHSGMKYYIDSFISILHKTGVNEIEVLSNYSYNKKHAFMPCLFKGLFFIKALKLMFTGVKLFITTLLRRNCVYIILSYGTIIDFWLLLCSLPARYLIVDGHEIIHQGSETNNKYQRLFSYVYKFINTVIIHSEKGRSTLESIGYKGEVMFVPHFEYNLDSNYDEKVIDNDVKSCIKRDKINVLFFGSLSYNKGIDILVENANCLLDVYKKKLNVIIAGKPTDDTLSQLSITDDIFSSVIRLISDDEMKYLYSNTDYVILPYRVTFQSGVLEMAFNYRRPVIISDIPYFRSMLSKYPSFGILTRLERDDFQKVLTEIHFLDTDNFYKPEDVYSYQHKPEMDSFICEMRDYLGNLS